jgi:hypothetical protein
LAGISQFQHGGIPHLLGCFQDQHSGMPGNLLVAHSDIGDIAGTVDVLGSISQPGQRQV